MGIMVGTCITSFLAILQNLWILTISHLSILLLHFIAGDPSTILLGPIGQRKDETRVIRAWFQRLHHGCHAGRELWQGRLLRLYHGRSTRWKNSGWHARDMGRFLHHGNKRFTKVTRGRTNFSDVDTVLFQIAILQFCFFTLAYP